MTSERTRENGKQAWLVVAAGFCCMMVAAGIGWFVFPVYMDAIQRDTGWSLQQMTLAVTAWALVGGAFSPLCGRWIDRYGARTVMTCGTLCQIIATALLAYMTHLWQLYAILILSSIGNVANTHVPISTAISQWFEEKRGTALGIALVGMGVGGFIMPVLADFFLERWGWRTGYLIFTPMLVVLLVPILLWMRPLPLTENAREPATDAADKVSEEGPFANDLSASTAARTRSFWVVGIGDGLIGLVFAVINVHMVYFTTEAGVSHQAATFAFSTYLLLQSPGILVFGALADRLSVRHLMIFCYGVPTLAMLFLFHLTSPVLLYSFAIICGICGGGRTALYPVALGECFGVLYLGTILGWLNIPFMIGNSVGPALGGILHDWTGNYSLVFKLCVVFALISGVLVSLMRNERQRPSPEPAPELEEEQAA